MFLIIIIRSKKQQDEEKLKKYIYDESVIYQPDGSVLCIYSFPIIDNSSN